jgi:hypothetical protein
MKIFKSFDLNSTILEKLKTLMGNIFFYGFFMYLQIFMEKLSLNVILLSPFVGIVKM